MTTRVLWGLLALLVAAGRPVQAQSAASRDEAVRWSDAASDAARAAEEQARAAAAADRARERELQAYERAQEAIERDQWTDAVTRFQAIAEAAGARADAALYWKAYALDKLGQRVEALTAVADLTRTYPKSRWLSDARALELRLRQRAGQAVAVDTDGDDDLKLLALNALQFSSPDQAIPMLQRILQGAQPIKLKERALFVLAQSQSPEARKVLVELARQGNPDLQRRAIDYMGVHGSAENRAVLAELYQSSQDVVVKRRVLRAYMVAGDRARVLSAATSEPSEELRIEAVRQLGVMGGNDELWQLYQKEAAVPVKRQILQAMFVGGNGTRLIELARTESNVELRRTAVRNLGLMSAGATGSALVEIYATQKDVETRSAAIQGLFVQDNAAALVALARKESDPAMKRELVKRLSTMQNKAAMDYLLELLGK